MSLKDRTKVMFADAMLELSKTKSISDITVTDLIKYCGVNRYTFYYHFKDKYDLMLYIMVNQTKEALLHATDDDSIVNIEQLYAQLLFMKEHKYFFKNAFSDDSPYSLMKSWNQFTLGMYRGMFCRALDLEKLPDDLDASLRFVNWGTIGLVTDWLQSDCQVSPDKLMYFIEQNWYKVFGTFDGQVSLKRSFHEYLDVLAD